MTTGLPSDPELQSSDRQGKLWRHLFRIAVIAGGVLLVGGSVAGWIGYSFLRRELPGFLQSNLSAALGRPIKVGQFERLGLRGVRLGPSIVPPTETNYTWVKAQALEVSFNPLELILTRTLRPTVIFERPEMSIKQGFSGNWNVDPPKSVGQKGLIRTELKSLQIRNANLAIGPISRASIVEVPEGVTSATLILLRNVNLRVRYGGSDNQTADVIVGGRLNNGSFQIRGEGQLDTRQANLMVRAQQIPIDATNPLFGGNLFIRDGLISCNLEAKLRPEATDPFTVKGTARLRNGDIFVTDLPSPFQDINGTMVLDGVGGHLEHSSLKFGPILVRASGGLDLHKGHNLTLDIPDVSVNDVETAFVQPLPVDAEGRFRVKTVITGPLLQPQANGELRNLDRVRLDRLGIGAIIAQFTANLQGFTLNRAEVRPETGGVITAQGMAGFRQEDLLRPDLDFTAQTDLPLDGLAALYDLPLPASIHLGPLRAAAHITGKPDDLRGSADWTLLQATFPGRGRVTYTNPMLQARDTHFQVGDGSLTAAVDANLRNFDWRASVVGDTLGLGLLSPQLRGSLDTNLTASGNLLALTPEEIQAQGQIRLSHAIPLNPVGLTALNGFDLDPTGLDQVLPGPLTAQFAWNGHHLQVPEAKAPNLYASGGVDVAFPAGGELPAISNLDFAARLSAFDLGAAYALLPGPDWVRPSGYIDFDGTLRGNLTDPQLAGTAGLRQFAINDYRLLADVSGPIRLSLSQGAMVDLRGGDTRIRADIDPSLRPNSFLLTNGEFVAEGQRQGDILNAQIHNFDIGALTLRPLETPDLGLVAGVLNANARLNLADLFDPDVVASFAITDPGIGPIIADSLVGNLQYSNGNALLTGGNLQLTPETRLLITGSGRLFPDWTTTVAISTETAQIQDLLQTLQLYSYADFGNLFAPAPFGVAADVTTTPVGDPNASLTVQAFLAQTMRQLQTIQANQQTTALLPGLDQLTGAISGNLQATASQQHGLTASFDFNGQNWAWGRYDFDNQFVARGSLQNQRLTLNPVAFTAKDTRLSLVGDVAVDDSDLQIRAEQLPLIAASRLLESPLEVSGLVNLDAHLTGPYTNPFLEGQFTVDQAMVNHQPLQEVSSSFQYRDAYFSVDGRVVGSDPEPLTFAGTVPYALPFMTVKPDSNQIALQASLKDGALSLVNLLTPLVVWDGGRANIDISIGGTLTAPTIDGIAAFKDAAFVSPFLNARLGSLTGQVEFQGDQIQVSSLTGSLFDGGFDLHGQLPILASNANPQDGLRLDLNTLNFNYFNEVYSQVDGYLSLTNALLQPVIGGDVHLQNTQVAVGPELLKLANLFLNPPPRVESLALQLKDLVPVRLDNLQVALAPASVKALPVLSINAQGNLDLSGYTNDLAANGVINVTDGWVNTVSAEFFLQGGHDNVVLFRPEYGLDPYLDLIFFARIPLQRHYNINSTGVSPGNTNEIPDLDALASDTIFDEIQVEAAVKGPATRLLDDLTLTSNPSYPQDQLLGMVSGGYLADLPGGGEQPLVLVANLLTAFTADTQDQIGRSLGFRQFRLGAATTLPAGNPEEGNDSFGLGVGLNLGITQNLSATFVQVLNQSQPIQFNLRYRIDDNWGIRGSTNFGNDSRVFMEYRVNLKK